MIVKESGTAILFETNVETSVDKFLPISQNTNVELTREGMGKNVAIYIYRKVIPYKLKTDRITLKKRIVIPKFYVIKWKRQTYSACH